jgi:uncharacterized protein YqeY
MLKDKLNADIKTALLSGNKAKVEVLRSLKSAILYEEVAQKVREEGLNDQQIEVVLAREAKKRGESAEMFQKGGQADRAQIELGEKAMIEEYLPSQLNDEELSQVISQVIAGLGNNAQMGAVIGQVKAKVGQSADGGRIAALVKQKLG